MKIRFSHIEWDLDDCDDEEVALPSEMTIEFDDSMELTDEALADALSDVSGWCVKSFDWEVVDEAQK